MSSFEIAGPKLKSKAEELSGLNNKFKNEITNLEIIEELLRDKWTGEANDKFHMKFINDKNKLERFTTLLDQYIQGVITITQLYEKVESSNCDILNTKR